MLPSWRARHRNGREGVLLCRFSRKCQIGPDPLMWVRCAVSTSPAHPHINDSIRSATRCAGSRSCPAVQSAAYPSVTSLDRAWLTSRLLRLRGNNRSCSATVMKQLRMP